MRSIVILALGLSAWAAADATCADISSEAFQRLERNHRLLRRYSWTLRAQVETPGDKFVGLYKLRYDLDGALQATPLDTRSPLPQELSLGVRKLARYAMSYALPGAYQFSRFLQRAEIWQGRGASAGSMRIEGRSLHQDGDSVELVLQDDKPVRMEAFSNFAGRAMQLEAEYRALTPTGPHYVARMRVRYPSENLVITLENFEYQPSEVALPRLLTLERGRALRVRLVQPLSTRSWKVGDGFEAILESDLRIDGTLVFTRGSLVRGRVVESRPAMGDKTHARMALALTLIYAASGPISLHTDSLVVEADVRVSNPSPSSSQALGALLTVTLPGREVDLAAETLLQFRLARPLELNVY